MQCFFVFSCNFCFFFCVCFFCCSFLFASVLFSFCLLLLLLLLLVLVLPFNSIEYENQLCDNTNLNFRLAFHKIQEKNLNKTKK